MSEIQDLEQQIEVLEEKIYKQDEKLRGLQGKLYHMRNKVTRLKSLEFIQENKLTKSIVQYDRSPGVPYFGNAYAFSDWLLKMGISEPWCVWGEIIYRTEDIKNKRMDRPTPARYSDLPS